MEKPSVFRYNLQDFIDAHHLVDSTGFVPAKKLLKVLAVFLLAVFVIFTGIYLFFNLLSLVSPGLFSGWTLRGYWNYLTSFRETFQIFGFAPAVVLLAFMAEPIIRFRLWLMIRNNPDTVREERAIAFSDQGLHYSTSSTDVQIMWNHFGRVIEGQKHFVLVKTKGSYLIVPKRIFANTMDEDRVRNFMKSSFGSIQDRT